MSSEFQIFISSTVEDLRPVRRDLKSRLNGTSRLVRCSEDVDFPVEPGKSSHRACLEVIRQCHAFVLLVGTRFGGEFENQRKSITWREWEEARNCGLTPIVLINKKTNDLCRRIAKERSTVESRKRSLSTPAVDELLQKKFAKELAEYHQAPALQRFVDVLRKGHKDNWTKLDWDGSPQEAIEYVQHNLWIQSAAADRRMKAALKLAADGEKSLRSIGSLTETASVVMSALKSGEIDRDQALQMLLDKAMEKRADLFGFSSERYTLVVHEVRQRKLHPIARSADSSVKRRGRVWAWGQSHVGHAVAKDEFMVSGDFRNTEMWVRNPQTDEEDRRNYVSVMTKPIYDRSAGTPIGAVTLSSDRVDHFTSPTEMTAVTFSSLVNLINMIFLGRAAHEQEDRRL